MDRRYPNKAHIVVDGEEAVERLMGLLREGTWLVEDNGMTDGDLSGERPETPTPNRGGGIGATRRESIESLSQTLGTKNKEEEDGDINMTDGPGEGGSLPGADGKDKGKGQEEGGQEGKGGQGLGRSKHADEGGEKKKEEETPEGNNGKTWEKIHHQFPLHESKALSGIMQDIIETAAAIKEARGGGEKGHLYREWLKKAQQKIVTDGNMVEACVGMNDIITNTHIRGGGPP